VDLKVELKRHVGKQGVLLAGERVETDVVFDQCFVYCNGQRVGIYCGLADQPNKHLSFTDIPPLPKTMQESIAAEVAKLTGGISHFTAPAVDEQEADSDDDE
jgi:hypothetical protein